MGVVIEKQTDGQRCGSALDQVAKCNWPVHPFT
jgi:hypothetical protein